MTRRGYYAQLAGFLTWCVLIGAASMAPQLRLWGINRWAYFSPSARVAWFIGASLIGCITVVLASRASQRNEPKSIPLRPAFGIAAVALIAGFLLFRNQVHFLGDGYQLLATLPSHQPYLKSRNFGGMMLPYVLMHLVGGPTKANALLAYQAVSVASGIAFMTVAYQLAKALVDIPVHRFLFWLGLCTAGYTLLFFGYVENYAPFLVSILMFCYVGVLVDRGKISRWWLWPSYLLTILFHIFGVALLPAVCYQFMKSSPEGSPLRSVRIQSIIWICGAALCIVVASYLIATNLFVRLSFVSVVPTRFTVAGYTLFSGRHLLDWLNLTVMLVPGILLLPFAARGFALKLKADHVGTRFIAFTSLALVGLAFVIDPGLGMPRDWDLFACAGVPLAILVYSVTVSSRDKQATVITILCIILQISLLVPRVGAMATPEKGLSVAKQYVRLDPHKCVTYSYVVLDYVRENFGADSALALQRDIEPLFPDDRLMDTGLVLLNQARFDEARPYFERATQANAMNYSAWADVGQTYLETNRYDSAVANLTIAAGINPYSGVIANNLAWAHYFAGHRDLAEKYWLRSRHLDTTSVLPLTGLVTLYGAAGDDLKYTLYFDSVIQRPDAPPEYLATAAESYCQAQRYDLAKAIFVRALQNGLDSLVRDSLVKKYPALQRQ